MSDKSLTARYSPTYKDVRNQIVMWWPIILMFAVTVIYALDLKHAGPRHFILTISLVYPIVIAFSILSSAPKINYTQLSSEGIRKTMLGFIHTNYYWSEIENVGPANIANQKAIGILYKPKHSNWIRALRKKSFGWDQIISNAYRKDGASLEEDVIDQFSKYSKK